MALFMPSQITPDVRSGLGAGTVDATQGMTVSWRINGNSAMTNFAVTIYLNDANSTQKYTTGKISTGCPAYGTTSSGKIQLFSYDITAATLSGAGITNGKEYKLVIQQWWSANDSITQSSASVFVTRKRPTLSISAIGTASVIDTRYYTFTGNYSQAQGDAMNWFRWQIAYRGQESNPFFDTQTVTGTMDISAYYDGFFTNTDYSIRLMCQTENGVEADTGWVAFGCSYPAPTTTGGITVACTPDTDAVTVDWGGIGSFPGTATGPYSISKKHILTLPRGSSIQWQSALTKPMSLAAPWSIIWKGQVENHDTDLFTVGENGSNITLAYDIDTKSLILSQNGSVVGTQTGIINEPLLTVVLTEDTMYIRAEYSGGGLYPATDLYPDSTLYPARDHAKVVSTYTVSVTYAQVTIEYAFISGYQLCHYFEVINGDPSADSITAAITNGTYVPGADGNDYMLADWTHGIDAGSLDIGGDTVIGFAVYRAKSGTPMLEKVAETDVNTESIYDYGATPGHGAYTYLLFPIGERTYIGSAVISDEISPCWFNWTLMECEETSIDNVFSVLAAYRFKYNVASGAMSNNNAPNVLKNFTPYPKIQLAPQNYKSGTITGLIGAVTWASGQPQYIDTIQLRDAIMALSVSPHPLFIKNRKGDLIRVKISGEITMTTADATAEQMQTASIPWVEVGDTQGVSLFALDNKGWSA